MGSSPAMIGKTSYLQQLQQRQLLQQLQLQLRPLHYLYIAQRISQPEQVRCFCSWRNLLHHDGRGMTASQRTVNAAAELPWKHGRYCCVHCGAGLSLAKDVCQPNEAFWHILAGLAWLRMTIQDVRSKCGCIHPRTMVIRCSGRPD